MKKFVHRPSPAMVVALLALIVAASGTAVAASNLKNGDKLIKKHSLSGNRLRNNTIVPNAANLGGQPASAYAGKAKWAIVQSDGTIAAQSGGISIVHSPGAGSYYLNFGEGLVGKPVLATINYGNFAGGTPHDGLISAAPCGSASTSDVVQTNCAGTNDANHLFVKTENTSAAGADRSFYVAVVR